MEKLEIKAKGVSVSHKNFKISDVTFSLKNGDVMGLIGRSGSGKSTLIKTIIGLKKPEKGKITASLKGKETAMNEIVGYSPQENSLYSLLTVEENLYTFGSLHGMGRKATEAKMKELLKRLDLEKARKKRVSQLSGGMMKRADLAVALISDPKVIVLDEPFTGLDIAIQRFVWDLLRELSSEGRIIIVSSHLLNDIGKNCNNFGLILDEKYYGTEEVAARIKAGRGKSLEELMEKMFNA